MTVIIKRFNLWGPNGDPRVDPSPARAGCVPSALLAVGRRELGLPFININTLFRVSCVDSGANTHESGKGEEQAEPADGVSFL